MNRRVKIWIAALLAFVQVVAVPMIAQASFLTGTETSECAPASCCPPSRPCCCVSEPAQPPPPPAPAPVPARQNLQAPDFSLAPLPVSRISPLVLPDLEPAQCHDCPGQDANAPAPLYARHCALLL